MSTMFTKIKIVLVAILAIIMSVQHVVSSKVLTLSGESDDENTLRQALYLVKLLKSDYVKSLRDNGDLEGNVTEEVNTTCPEDANSTTPMNLNSYTVSAPPNPMALPAMMPSPMMPPMMPPLPPNRIELPPPLQPAPANAASAAVPPPITYNAPPGNMPPAENYKYPYSKI